MKSLKFMLPKAISFSLVLVVMTFITRAENILTPLKKQSTNITYVDIGIHQPNVEDCFETSIFELDKDSDWIDIYPNPSPGQFTLELTLRYTGVAISITMYDATGRKVFEGTEFPEGNHIRKNLNVGDLPKGIYFIRIKGKDRVGVKQIIIN